MPLAGYAWLSDMMLWQISSPRMRRKGSNIMLDPATGDRQRYKSFIVRL